ncbi:MAG: haloacid dehalogenase-like hydrolase [Bryobacteraceae bacterium]|nr:haloacid dehalogenase-like hydrolase [Bryobacteraceae bacterium]
MPPALVLFDIDGTLVRRAGPHHREALENAVLRVTGVRATIEGVPVAGSLDRDILRDMMRNAGLPAAAIRRAMPEVVERAQSIYRRTCPDLANRVCPGVRRALAKLGREGAVVGIVSGNLSRIGWRKMERAGLRTHFRFGAFAEMGSTRGALAKLAVREAKRQGWIARHTPAVLIGDHANDIAAARHAGIRAVAVATGVLDRDTLAPHSPDVLLDDLRAFSLEEALG